MFKRALESIPCGVNSNFRYWGDEETLILKRAKGAYLWDQDDKKYIDYRLGFGPVVLGHAYEPVLEKIKEGLEIGNAFSMTHEYEATQYSRCGPGPAFHVRCSSDRKRKDP